MLRLPDGGYVSLTRRLPFTPQKISGTHNDKLFLTYFTYFGQLKAGL
jgi:hypothetical protein